jgi:hypothetical protein
MQDAVETLWAVVAFPLEKDASAQRHELVRGVVELAAGQDVLRFCGQDV